MFETQIAHGNIISAQFWNSYCIQSRGQTRHPMVVYDIIHITVPIGSSAFPKQPAWLRHEEGFLRAKRHGMCAMLASYVQDSVCLCATNYYSLYMSSTTHTWCIFAGCLSIVLTGFAFAVPFPCDIHVRDNVIFLLL